MRLQIWLRHGSNPASRINASFEDVAIRLRELPRDVPHVNSPTAPWHTELVVCSPSDKELGNGDDVDLAELVGLLGLVPSEVLVKTGTTTYEFNSYLIHKPGQDASCALDIKAYSIENGHFGICCVWSPVARLTKGILWFRSHLGQDQAEDVLARLGLGKCPQAHGLLPAYVVLQLQVAAVRGWVSDRLGDLVNVQNEIGYTRLFYTANHGRLDELDLSVMSKRVCELAINITTLALHSKHMVDLSNFILEEAKQTAQHYEQHRVHTSTIDEQSQCVSDLLLIHQIMAAKRRAKGLIAEAEAFKQQANILVQILLSLNTQRDQNLGIQIAADSRTLAEKATRDSNSMKAIAAVTMCFLPGTFVSSLFAVPMFDWNAAPKHVVNRQFWIYWVVTLPLTLAVIAIWLVWTNRESLGRIRRRRKQGGGR